MARHDNSPLWVGVCVLVSCLLIGSVVGSTAGPTAGTPLDGHASAAGASELDARSTAEPGANISLENVSAPAQIHPGEPFTVSATLVNPGPTLTVQQVYYSIGGHVIDATLLPIPAGDTTTVTFNVTAADTRGFPHGTVTHGVFTQSTQMTAPLTIAATATGSIAADARTADSTSFRVAEIAVPPRVTSGETMVVQATVSNPTPNRTTQVVELRLNGTVLQRETITLGPNEQTQLSFRVDTHTLQPHAYVLSVFTRDFGAVTSVTVEASTNTTATGDG